MPFDVDRRRTDRPQDRDRRPDPRSLMHYLEEAGYQELTARKRSPDRSR
jgi:hypothetical protein